MLEINNRITIYNYINEIKAYIAEFDYLLDYEIDIIYDSKCGDYIMERIKKNWDWISLSNLNIKICLNLYNVYILWTGYMYNSIE